MPSIKNQHVYETVIRGRDTRSGRVLVNVLHYRNRQPTPPLAYGTEIPASDLATFLAAVRTGWIFDVLFSVSEHYEVIDYVTKQITGYNVVGETAVPTYGDTALVPVNPGVDKGTDLGETLPLHATLSIKKRTILAGRRNRGALRLGPIVEANQSNGAVLSAEVAAVNTAMELFRTRAMGNGAAGDAGTMVLSVMSRVNLALSVVPLAESASWCTTVSNLLCNPNIGSAVKRKVRNDQLINQTA